MSSELGKVEIITDKLDLGESHYYKLTGLKSGDNVYIYMERVSGNLDPIIGMTKDYSDFIKFEDFFTLDIPRALENGLDFTEVLPGFADSYFLAWDDNGGELSDASLAFQVQEAGDYQLVVAGTYYHLLRDEKFYTTFGKYRLTIGVNSPKVQTGKAQSTGHNIASQIGKFHKRVQEKTDEITEEKEFIQFPLNALNKGDDLYVYVETVSGDLKPTIKLRDYGNRLLRYDNISGEADSAKIEYTFKEEGENYTLIIRGDSGEEDFTQGKFRILIGTNTPEVLTGKSKTFGRPVIREPIELNTLIAVDQISNIDQRRENFTVVGYFLMNFTNPGYAFNPDTCKCSEIDYTREQFYHYISENNLDAPNLIFLNQQGRRFIQQSLYRVLPDGEVKYFERFTVTLQAPDFNFRRFPFDPQKFFIRALILEPEDFYIFKANDEIPAIGKKLGEEEWVVTDYQIFIESRVLKNIPRSEYILEINVKRHINYYMFRIFLPLLLIIVVSWGTFFMKDYSNRIAVSVSNLLIFVAFNFSIGSDLPRLGYITFMDSFIFAAFFITAITVLINVFFRRLEIAKKIELAQLLDGYLTFIYPIIYLIVILSLVWIFLI